MHGKIFQKDLAFHNSDMIDLILDSTLDDQPVNRKTGMPWKMKF